MPFLETAIKTLVVLGVVFFTIFSYLCLLWTEREKEELRNMMGAMMVSLLYTFKIIIFSFVIILILHLFLERIFNLL